MPVIDEIKQSVRDWALSSSLAEIESLISQMRVFLDLSKDTKYLIETQARYMVELEVLDQYVLNLI